MDKFLQLPPLASEHGRSVDNLIIYIHWLMIALFIGWLGYFAWVLIRFRRSRHPRADHTGVTSHASSWVEGLVALIEGVLLIGFAIPWWAHAVDDFPAEKDSTVMQIVAQQFNWNVRYPGPDGIFGRQDMSLVNSTNAFGVDPKDPHSADDFDNSNEIHVVVNKPVIAWISSKDVIHSFKIIAMRITQDAIPGMRVPIHFKPTKVGRYQINCAQLCGNSHATMSGGVLVVEEQKDFDDWVKKKLKAGAVGPID